MTMTFTPFEMELLKKIDRTNELLEYLLMAHQPMKFATGDPGEAGPLEQQATQIVDQLRIGMGMGSMRIPGRATPPPTEEERAAKFAARAKEVGLSDEAAAAVSARVKDSLGGLVAPGDPAVGTAQSTYGALDPAVGRPRLEVEAEDEAAARAATPRKRAAKRAQ